MRGASPLGVLRRPLERALLSVRVPVYRSSYALILTTGANAVLGLGFWVLAARLFSADVVGLGAGGISALQLVATIGWVGLRFTLLRYLPVAGSHRAALVTWIYIAGMAVASVACAVFVIALADEFDVSYITSSPWAIAAFAVSVAAWVVFSLQDAALVGLRRSMWVPLENTAYGALKLVVIIPLAALGDPWVLLGAWAGCALLLDVVVTFAMYRRWLGGEPAAPAPDTRKLSRFSVGHTGVAVLSWLPDFLVPLLVLRFLDADANAFYYAAWTIGSSIRLLAYHMSDAFTAEAAYDRAGLGGLLRAMGRLSLFVLVPVMLVVALAAEPILSLFGPDYAEEGATLLVLFALSLIPFTVLTMVVAIDRVHERFGAAFAVTGLATAVTIGLDWVLLPTQGITGAGLGWLGGQIVGAIAAVAGLALRSPRLRQAGRPSPGRPAPEPAE